MLLFDLIEPQRYTEGVDSCNAFRDVDASNPPEQQPANFGTRNVEVEKIETKAISILLIEL